MTNLIEVLIHDPMFWAVAICINVIMLLRQWKEEGSIALFRCSLGIALILNSALLGYTYAMKYVL